MVYFRGIISLKIDHFVVVILFYYNRKHSLQTEIQKSNEYVNSLEVIYVLQLKVNRFPTSKMTNLSIKSIF